ncbi:MAG: penicillin acylase family protein [bacterium]
MVTQSLPKTNITLDIACIDTKVDVYRDKYSIPHVVAQNEYDLYFTQGFITSQDRFWQMDIIKRAAQGKLSEIFGSLTIKHDKTILKLGFKRRAQQIASNLSSDAKQALEAYVEGINCYIENDNLPIEYKLLYYTPEIWTIEDCISIMQFWEWQMDRGWKIDLIKDFLTDTLGTTKFKKHFSYSKEKKILANSKLFAFLKPLLTDPLPASFPRIGYDFCAFMLSENKSLSSAPLVSLIVNTNPVIPCIFYEIHLAGKITNMYGFSIPGIPGVLMGYNEYIIWGAGNPKNHAVRFRPIQDLSSVFSLTTYNDTLKIAPDSSLNVKSYQLDNRPLIPINSKTESSITEYVMIDWPGFELHTLWDTFYQIGKARDRKDFDKAVQNNYSNSLSFFYADKETIHNSRVYAAEGYDMNGDLQTTSSKNSLIISQLGRKIRVHQLLDQQDSISMQDVKRMQSDEYSIYADTLKKKITSLINPCNFKKKIERDILEKLTVWKGDMKAGSSEAVFFQTFMYKIFRKSLENEISDSLITIILLCNPLYYEIVYSIINDIYSGNAAISILIDSFKEAVEYLQNKLSEDISQWSWGALHRFWLQNPMGANPFLKSTYNLGSFAAGGSFHTIDKYTSDLNSLFSVQSIPGAKMIIDLQGKNSSISVLSTGQSGQPFDDHYRDQVELSIYNFYHSNMTDTTKLDATGWDHLIIR